MMLFHVSPMTRFAAKPKWSSGVGGVGGSDTPRPPQRVEPVKPIRKTAGSPSQRPPNSGGDGSFESLLKQPPPVTPPPASPAPPSESATTSSSPSELQSLMARQAALTALGNTPESPDVKRRKLLAALKVVQRTAGPPTPPDTTETPPAQ